MIGEVPAYRSRFVGRSREVDDLAHVISRHRVVTVVGPGGVGKTRLTVNVIAATAGMWPGGAAWVDLTTASGDIAEFVADELDVLIDPVAGPMQSLAAALSRGRQLLCLDNCESAIDDASDLVHQLAAACPELHLVATSREVLRVDGETVWRVPALSDADAIELFNSRRPATSNGPAEDAIVQRICRRLDGMPLAIEFAAGWIRSMSLEQIESGLDDRFALLVRGPRRAPERHETLLASMQWSYDLLDTREQTVLRRLGVLVGSFDASIAAAVVSGRDIDRSEVPLILRALVDKSLVDVADDASTVRFRLLDTVRDFARHMLDIHDEAGVTRQRHVSAIRARIDDMVPLRNTDKDRWRAQVLLDYPNIRAALEWGLLSGNPDDACHLAAGVAWFWHLTRYGSEGIGFLDSAIRCVPAETPRLRAELYTSLALVADTTSPIDREFDLAQRALQIADDVGAEDLRPLPLLLAAVGRLYHDAQEAVDLSYDAAAAAAEVGDDYVTDGALAVRGCAWHMMDRHRDAMTILEPLVDRFLRRGERTNAAAILTALTNGHRLTGDIPAALHYGALAVQTADPLGDFFAVGSSRAQHATTQIAMGAVDAAERTLGPILEASAAGMFRGFAPSVLFAVVDLRRRQDRLDEAVEMLERQLATHAFDHSYLGANVALELVTTYRCAGRIADAVGALNKMGGDAAAVMGRTHARLALERGLLTAESDPSSARESLHEALAEFVERDLVVDALGCIEAFAIVAARVRENHDSARLWACADSTRTRLGLVREPSWQATRDQHVGALSRRVVADEFERCWALGDATSLNDMVEYIRRGRGARGRPDHGWDSLTPAEASVAELVAAGLSNPQVGVRLFMSRSTVKSHLSRVFTKLDISNRTELAGLVSKRDSGG